MGEKARSVGSDKVFVLRFLHDPASQPIAWRGLVKEQGEPGKPDELFDVSGLSDACKAIAERLKNRS